MGFLYVRLFFFLGKPYVPHIASEVKNEVGAHNADVDGKKNYWPYLLLYCI